MRTQFYRRQSTCLSRAPKAVSDSTLSCARRLSTADTLQRSVNEVQDAVERARSVASALQGWLAGARSNLADAAFEESTGTRRRRAKAQSTAGGSDAPAWAINGGNRVDYQLQETELEAAQEYLAALKAHTCYFGNADLASFFLREICSR